MYKCVCRAVNNSDLSENRIQNAFSEIPNNKYYIYNNSSI